MYHGRFKGSHYNAGYKWGNLLYKNNKIISKQHTFKITEERRNFVKDCLPIYKKYYPEILEEIKGIADGQQDSYDNLCTFLLSMYCFEFDNHCTCIAFKDKDNIIFGRNSDFLVELEKLYMNCLYNLDNVYAFNGNTTAFVEMEDGVNEYGLAIGLTFIYPTTIKAGFNAGLLVRYLLEKCKTTNEVVESIKTLPIASQQTLTVVDCSGNIAVIECNSENIEVIKPNKAKIVIIAILTAAVVIYAIYGIWQLATKPTTVIFDNAVNLAPNLIAEDGSIGMRVTQEDFSKELCYRFQKPIVSTSANISGEPAAENYKDISEELLNSVDYVCYSRRQEIRKCFKSVAQAVPPRQHSRLSPSAHRAAAPLRHRHPERFHETVQIASIRLPAGIPDRPE